MRRYKTEKPAAFTLAEVLITLVIIGIVAALTIPSVVVSYKKHQTATQLKKAYSALSQTTNKAIADHGPIKNWDFETGKTKEFVDKYVAPYLKVLKNCEYGTTGACEFKFAKMNNQTSSNVYDNTHYKLILNDGTCLYFQNYSDMFTKDGVTIPRKATKVYIDVNGQKGPNVYGKDIFYYLYWILNDGTGGKSLTGTFEPNGVRTNREAYLSDNCSKQKSGMGCAGLIMIDGWEIKSDYPW